jgi:RNA polymerase sigma-70 factor (ECF subfamily)
MTNAELSRLLERISTGDRQAFAELYSQLEKPLFRFVRTKLNDPFASADILQEVFLEIWRSAGSFQERSSVKTWVFAIAYRKVMDVFRKDRRLAGEDEMPDQVDEAQDAVQCIIAAQEKDMVQYCLKALKPEHRSAIELTFFEDMSYREVAQVIGIPEGTAKTRVFHAKSLLMRCLQARLKKGMAG